MSRQITDRMLTALAEGREWKQGNTSTHRGEHGMLVRLHDNPIAVVEADRLRICAAGWATATTCDRLNAIAYEFAGATVGRRKGDIRVVKNDLTTLHGASDWIELPHWN